MRLSALFVLALLACSSVVFAAKTRSITAGLLLSLDAVTASSKATTISSGHPAGLAFLCAIEEINVRTDILPLTNLQGVWNDTKNKLDVVFGNTLSQRDTNRAVSWIGPANSDTALPTAWISTIYNQPQISFAATSPSFDNPALFPNFFRTIGSIVTQTQTLANALVGLGWNRVSYISTIDSLSLAASSSFAKYATELGMTLVTPQIIAPPSTVGGTDGQTDVAYQMQLIKKARAHIIGVFCPTASFSTIVSLAITAGLYGPSYMWFSHWDIMKSDVWTNADGTINAQVYNFSQNMIGVLPHVDTTTTTYKHFANIYSNFRLVPDFSTAYQQTPPTRANLAFDATYAWAYAANAALDVPQLSDSFVTNSWDLAAKQILNSMGSVNFQGATGNVQFDSRGSRIMPYDVVQMQNGIFVPVAAAYPPSMALTWFSSDPVNRGLNFPNNLKMGDDDVRVELSSGQVLQNVSLVLFIVGFLIAAWLWTLLSIYSKRPMVKPLGPSFMRIILIGTMIGLGGLVFSPMDTGNVSPATWRISCMGNLWCVDVGFVLILGALMAKSRKIVHIFAKQGLHTAKLSDKNLLRMIFLLLVGDCIILGVWTGLSPITSAWSVDSTPVTFRPICTSANFNIYISVTMVYKGMMLLRALLYNLESRKAPTPDAHTVDYSIWTIIVAAAIAILAVLTTGTGQLTMFNTLKLIGILVGTYGVMFVTFAPFVYAVLFDQAALDIVPDTNIDKKSSGLPNSVQDVLGVRSRSRFFGRRCYFSEKKAKSITSLILTGIMLAYAVLSLLRMLDSYSNPSVFTTLVKMSSFTVPGMMLCMASNISGIALNPQPRWLYSDPRLSFYKYIDPINTFPDGSPYWMDCCLTKDQDIFISCYPDHSTCPKPVQFRQNIVGQYGSWNVAFDCVDIAPGISVPDPTTSIFIPYNHYQDNGLLSLLNSDALKQTPPVFSLNNPSMSNSSDSNFDPGYLTWCNNYQFWPHKYVLFSYIASENQTNPIDLFYGLYDQNVGGPMGRWRVDVAQAITRLYVSQFTYLDLNGNEVPSRSGYKVAYEIDVPYVSVSHFDSFSNPARRTNVYISWLRINFSFQLSRIQPLVTFTFFDLVTCLLAIIAASPVIMNFFVGQGDYDPTGLINKLFFFDVPTMKGTASSQVLQIDKLKKVRRKNDDSIEFSDDSSDDNDDSDTEMSSTSGSQRGRR